MSMVYKKSIFATTLLVVLALLCVSFAGFFCTGRASAVVDEYTIRYLDSDDAHTPITTTNPTTVSLSELPLVIENATTDKLGYKFGFWGFNKNYSLDINKDNKFILTEADLDNAQDGVITLYAYWILTEYEVNVSYVGVEYGQVRDAQAFDENNYTITAADDFDLTSQQFLPTCSGHQFVGWYSDAACLTPVTRLNEITADVNLWGKFSKQQLFITFADQTLGLDPIEFRANMDRAYDYRGVEGLLSDITPQKEGFRFDGWYTNEACDDAHKVGQFYIFTAPVTLYAKWVPNPSPVWWFVFGGGILLATAGFLWWFFANKKLTLN